MGLTSIQRISKCSPVIEYSPSKWESLVLITSIVRGREEREGRWDEGEEENFQFLIDSNYC